MITFKYIQIAQSKIYNVFKIRKKNIAREFILSANVML